MKAIFAALALACPHLLAGPVSLFDGKTLEGWDHDPKMWRVEDGTITGGSTTDKIRGNHFICTKRIYQNFDLKMRIKCSGDPATGLINSGIQIRSMRVPGGEHMTGYQIDCGDGWFGKIYDEFRRNKVIAEPIDAKALAKAVDVFGWNEYRIRAEGRRIRVWINNVPAIDYTEENPNIALDGRIGPQVHSGGVCLVQVKDVTIEELPRTEGAPTWESLGGPVAASALARSNKPKAPTPAPPAKRGGKNPKPAGAKSGALTPEEELAAFKLPPGFEAELIAAEDVAAGTGKFVPLAFDQKGAIWTTTAFEYPVDGNENPAAADALYAGKGKDKVLVYDRDPDSPTGYSPKARVFAEGLAIPLGVLPYGRGCYVQHGHDIVFLEDTDADGKADKRTVVLTGFGVQDSHLFPHQFMRAPGGWLWLAQGAFNYSQVRRPDQPAEKAVKFDQTRMAKFRPDGTAFDITSNGPCNIWGLVLNGEGEAFIQEANDFGYPVMPFHEYANYPGCSDRVWKSYAPEFPATAPDFRMGGTGLSGLALTDKNGIFPEPWRDMMLVANPITNRIQAIRMNRDGAYWKLDKPVDFLVSEDPWFRPVAIQTGPDGCLYIVDWYNQIISHNEVARNHPDRDKIRGRIWRVKPTGSRPLDVPDFTTLGAKELIGKLGGESLAQSHLAWQAIGDRKLTELLPTLREIILDDTKPGATRIAAFWAAGALETLDAGTVATLAAAQDRNLRREAVRYLGENLPMDARTLPLLAKMAGDADPEVRAEVIRSANRVFIKANGSGDSAAEKSSLTILTSLARGAMAEPTAPSTRGARRIKVREAYDREFERYLVRMFLEANPAAVARFLASDASHGLPVEARLLAALAQEPRASAARVAELLPMLKRAPEQEEVLRLAQFPDRPGSGNALRAALVNPATRAGTLESLIAVNTRLDAAKLAPFLDDASVALLTNSDPKSVDLGVRLASVFKLTKAEPALLALAEQGGAAAIRALGALAAIGSKNTSAFVGIIESAASPEVRNAALEALASSKAADAPGQVIALYPKLEPARQRVALGKLTTTREGARALVAAASSGVLPKTDLDAAALDRLLAVLGDEDAALNSLVEGMSSLFRPILKLDGSDKAFCETGLTLDGPLTVETWLKLASPVSNSDGLLGVPGKFDLNFHDSKLRVWAGPGSGDIAIAKRIIAPGLWTHVAATRDSSGNWKLFIDGTPEDVPSKPAAGKLEAVRIAATNASKGTQGEFAEFRIWNRERTASEIIANFDRGMVDSEPGLVFNSAGKSGWGTPQPGAKVQRSSDLPPVLTAAEAKVLDAKFAKYSALAQKPGDIARGKQMAMACTACHVFGTEGGNIGPNLSGVGAMGTTAILRNILTPNAAMESAYHIYRVERKDGAVIDAFFVSEDKDAVVIRIPGGGDQRIAKKNIARASFLRRSLMPEGLLDAMTDQQASDLLAYLLSLK